MTTVRELIDNLADHDPAKEVTFACGVREFTLDQVDVADDGSIVVELDETP